MPAIGFVMKQPNGSFKGNLKTLSISVPLEILPNTAKSAETQPDYRVMAKGVEIGAAWVRKSQTSGNDYIRLSLADPLFGPRNIYANLGQAAGQDDADVFAVIWNPED